MPPEMLTLEWFADSYGFTEDETLGLSMEALDWWPIIRAGRAHAREIERAREERMARTQSR
jgi:hypothetical protein